MLSYSFEKHLPKIVGQTHTGQALYALIDAGQLPELAEQLSHLVPIPRMVALFEGTLAHEALSLSPLLIELAPAQSGKELQPEPIILASELNTRCKHLPILSYLLSPLSFEALSAHLRSLLRLKMSHGTYMLRFADTQMLGGICSILMPAQRAAFFKGISTWLIVNQRSQIINVCTLAHDAKPVALPLYFEDSQCDLLFQATQFSLIRCQIGQSAPNFLEHLSHAEQTEFVIRNLDTLYAQGITEENIIISHCFSRWEELAAQHGFL